MIRRGHAKLYINDDYVGDVAVQGTEDSWSHGNFRPQPQFTKYAPLFGRWSLMMHADGPNEPISQPARDELRSIEFKIDRLAARLHFIESDTWVPCSQLNIDGRLIEWKSG